MDTIYLEEALHGHPRVLRILERYPNATLVECERWGEVFNVRAQNFRLQKRRPALILAEKHGKTVLPAPPGYSIGRSRNYYFSHMLNCLYDCRYCFLQGMYQSAHFVYFVNFDSFQAEIDTLLEEEGDSGELCFFSGYDCDSLAMESLTRFAEEFLPFFAERPRAWLELRTKSINTKVLEDREALPNVIVACTLTPGEIAREIEHGAPSAEQRLNRVERLAQQGWKIGLRLDPLIPWPGFEKLYPTLIDEVMSRISPERIHSVTLGPMRFPKAMYERILKLYPEDRLFTLEEMELQSGQMSYCSELESQLVGLVENRLLQHLPRRKLFRQT